MWTNSPNSAWKILPVDDDASHHPRSNQRPEASLNTRRASQQNRNDDPIITHETNRKRLAYAVHGNKGELGHDDHACAESSRHRAVAGLAESSFFLGGVVLSVGLLGMALVVISPSTLRDFEAGGMSVALAVESLSGLHTIPVIAHASSVASLVTKVTRNVPGAWVEALDDVDSVCGRGCGRGCGRLNNRGLIDPDATLSDADNLSLRELARLVVFRLRTDGHNAGKHITASLLAGALSHEEGKRAASDVTRGRLVPECIVEAGMPPILPTWPWEHNHRQYFVIRECVRRVPGTSVYHLAGGDRGGTADALRPGVGITALFESRWRQQKTPFRGDVGSPAATVREVGCCVGRRRRRCGVRLRVRWWVGLWTPREPVSRPYWVQRSVQGRCDRVRAATRRGRRWWTS
ncbi:hypothetical protein PSPO01_14604 [Paraphaeosphaeria sporulosa]